MTLQRKVAGFCFANRVFDPASEVCDARFRGMPPLEGRLEWSKVFITPAVSEKPPRIARAESGVFVSSLGSRNPHRDGVVLRLGTPTRRPGWVSRMLDGPERSTLGRCVGSRTSTIRVRAGPLKPNAHPLRLQPSEYSSRSLSLRDQPIRVILLRRIGLGTDA